MTNIVTMIPVRMASTRLPNKPLLDINGKSLLQRVYENVKKTVPGDVFVAAGDRVIVEACEKFGAKAVLTDPALPSGTDRIAAALKKLIPKENMTSWSTFRATRSMSTRPSTTS